MQGNGYSQGYFLGLFARFLWHFTIAFVLQSLVLYIFGINIFTYWILAIILSFFINTALPIKENYPFFRHGLIYFCLILALSYSSTFIINVVNLFFTPNGLWIFFAILSVLFGIVASFGRYGRGTYSTLIESVGNICNLIVLILAFVFYWWHGGIVYLILRLPLTFVEVSIANMILYGLKNSYESNTTNISE